MAVIFFDIPPDNGQIGPFGFFFLDLFCQGKVGLVILGADHHPAGIFVQPVDDAGPDDPVDPRKVFAVVQQGIDQCPIRIPSCRMDHHTSRFVHHDYILVLVEDIQRDIFRLCLQIRRRQHRDLEHIARFHFIVGLHWLSFPGDQSFLDVMLDIGPGASQPGCQEHVRPQAFFFCRGRIRHRQGGPFWNHFFFSGLVFFPDSFSSILHTISPTPRQIKISATLNTGQK